MVVILQVVVVEFYVLLQMVVYQEHLNLMQLEVELVEVVIVAVEQEQQEELMEVDHLLVQIQEEQVEQG